MSWSDGGCVCHCSSWPLAGSCLLGTCGKSQPFQGQLAGSSWSCTSCYSSTPALRNLGTRAPGQGKKGSMMLLLLCREDQATVT